jgi:hypothetical protein
MDQASENPRASEAACERIGTNFNNATGGRDMFKIKYTSTIVAFALVFAILGAFSVNTAEGQGVSVTVKGESWDSDSRGFAKFMALSKVEREVTSARRGSRISLDGHPDKFAIAGPGPGFELSFTTAEPSFRLIVEGDRFPRTISQPFSVPKGGGEIDVGLITAPRAEGPEHTWPLPMAAKKFGYRSPHEMLADNKAVIRILVWSSGADGVPPLANDTTVSVEKADAEVIPFTMDKKDTFFQLKGPRIGAFLVIVPFGKGEPDDKDVVIKVTDTVSNPTWEPPRPWTYDPVVVSVRNGFATEINVRIKID